MWYGCTPDQRLSDARRSLPPDNRCSASCQRGNQFTEDGRWPGGSFLDARVELRCAEQCPPSPDGTFDVDDLERRGGAVVAGPPGSGGSEQGGCGQRILPGGGHAGESLQRRGGGGGRGRAGGGLPGPPMGELGGVEVARQLGDVTQAGQSGGRPVRFRL